MKNTLNYPAKYGSYRDPYQFYYLILISFPLLVTISMTCSPHLQNRGRFPETKTVDQIIIDMKNWADLTDEQEGKIRPIIEEQVKKRKELIKNYIGQEREAIISLRDELRDLRVTTAKQLQYFLTNKQMVEYGGMQQEEDERLSRRKGQEEMNQKRPRDRGPR